MASVKKQYGVMLIGCGYIGEQHLSDIAGRKEFSVVAVVDTNEQLAISFSRRFHAALWGTDYKPFLNDPRIDIVIVATYTGTHFEITRDCLNSGKHVICEKPIAANMEDALAFVRMVKQSPCKVTVSYVLRYNESYRKIKELIQSGEIGDLRLIRMEQSHKAGGNHPWERFLKLMEDCTPLVDCGVHYADLAQWMTGSSVIAVSGISAKLDEDSPVDNYQLMTMKLANGCTAYYEVGWSKNINSGNTKDFIGTLGHITLTMAANRKDGVHDRDLICISHNDGTVRRLEVKSVYKDMYGQAKNLVNMIETGSEGVVSIDDVYSALRIVQTAQIAIDTGRVLSPFDVFPEA